ncbi:porin [Pigmentiphaga sp. YJ18]|uniref:porin n=1 Tax=Pigmentiphaga sp. YJ18 TaxID=3134907 RepID=UPI00310CBD35
MYQRILVAGAAALLSTQVHAQSSVTIYGVADVSIRYLTHADRATGRSKLSMENGAVSNSRWGFRGVEDLGNGLSALFNLEGGMNLDDGTQSTAGRIFNRQSFMGLSSRTAGTLTFGLQNNPLFDFMVGPYDPMTLGNYSQNSWMGTVFSVAGRRGKDNSIKYTNTFGDFRVAAFYGMGEQPDNHRKNEAWSGTVSYTKGPFSTGGGFVLTHDALGNKQTVYNLNLRYKLGPATLFLGHFNSKDHTGFVDAFLNGGATPSATAPRRDNAWFTGLTYDVMPSLKLTSAFYYDRSKNVRAVQGDAGEGTRYALVLLADYYLSRRTTLYATVDYNKVKDAARVDIPGGNSQTGVAIGLRHRF